jgi:Mrp family chromosome partitioning ATPase
MERLQAALETARKQRSELAGTPPPPRVPQGGPAAVRSDATADQLWASLQPFDPDALALRRHRVVTREASRAATPFDILRTKILLQMRQNGWTRLAITSPVPRTGKSTTACNLALGFGRQQELRSMLFDLDLREPSVHDFFQYRPEHSIGEVIAGTVPLAQQALRIGTNVAVSMANRAERDPTRLLLAERTATVLDDIQAAWKPDLMIFDLPSVLVSDDTRAFLKNVDCALIIARANSTRYGQFDACEREIAEHTNVLGVVLNAVRNLDSASSFD